MIVEVDQCFTISYYALKAHSFESSYLRIPRPASARRGSADQGFAQSCEDTYSRCIEECKSDEWNSSIGFSLPAKFASSARVVPDIRPLNHICELLQATVEEQGGGRYVPPWWLTGSLWGPNDTAGLSSPAELSELVRQLHSQKFLEVLFGSRKLGVSCFELLSLARFLESQVSKDVWLLGTRKS